MSGGSSNSNNEAERAFVDWFKANGATLSPSVGLTDFEGMGRGAVALQDIQPDTLLFSIPRSILLNTTTSTLSSLVPLSELSGWTPLILSIMYEHLRTTKWKPYFQLLPTQFDSLMFWTEEELSDLKGSIVLNKIGKEEAEEAYTEELLPFLERFPEVFGEEKRKREVEFSLELFHRCGSWILSRSFHVESSTKTMDEEEKKKQHHGHGDDDDDAENDEEEEEEEEEREDVGDVALVPMADLLNARFGSDNARLFYEPNTLNMMSTTSIPAGSQIFNTYADPPNSDLLRRYGHVDAQNDADLVEITLEQVVELVGGSEGSILSDEAQAERAEWLLEMGVEDTFILDKSHELPEELLSTIRTLLLDQEGFEKIQKKEVPPKPRLDPVSARWAVKILEEREKEYPTSIEEDESLLEQPNLAPRKKMAVIVRLGEKRLLREAKREVLGAFPAETEEERKQKGEGEKKRKGEKEKSEGKRSKRSKA